MTSSPHVVVIGAGPAGLAAAVRAADAGARVTVVDESWTAGGQYLHPELGATLPAALVRRLTSSGVALDLGSAVWHIDTDRRVVHTVRREIEYDALVLATGAYDRSVPVVGATKRGVMSIGGAQLLSKQRVRLQGPVLIAGTGPLTLVLAARLGREDIAVAEVCMTHVPRMMRAAALAPAILPEGLRLAGALLRHHTPVRPGWVLDEVTGDNGAVEGAWVRRLSPSSGDPERRFVPCRTVAIGYGFVPQLALADLVECRLSFDDTHRTWFADVAADGTQTSVPGVFACGELTGIGGHRKAAAEGALAGAEAAQFCGQPVRGVWALSRRAVRMRRFAALAAEALAPPDVGLSSASATVCRCESVDVGSISGAVDDGATDVPGVRMRTRCGMGPCQGRLCMQSCAEVIHALSGVTVQDAGRIRARTPARPLSVQEATG